MFIFENYWVDFDSFLPTVQQLWNNAPYKLNPAMNLNAKLKFLRSGLKAWSKKLSNLNILIGNCNIVLGILDGLGDQSMLNLIEKNFRRLVKRYLLKLLEAKRIYWKQRSTIRWVTFGDENTSVFQAYASQQFKKNQISQLRLEDGTIIQDHNLKAAILWNSFKERMGNT